VLLNFVITEAVPLLLICVPLVPIHFHSLKARKSKSKGQPSHTVCLSYSGLSLTISDETQHESVLKTKFIPQFKPKRSITLLMKGKSKFFKIGLW
jgi:hypothetical protein